MLHYIPQHVSSSTLLIIRRTNCITTASGIVTLCKQPYSVQVESGLQSALHLHNVRLFTEGDDTRGCGDTICPPEDEQRAARNMLKSVVWHTYCWKIKELCMKLVIWKSLKLLVSYSHICKRLAMSKRSSTTVFTFVSSLNLDTPVGKFSAIKFSLYLTEAGIFFSLLNI